MRRYPVVTVAIAAALGALAPAAAGEQRTLAFAGLAALGIWMLRPAQGGALRSAVVVALVCGAASWYLHTLALPRIRESTGTVRCAVVEVAEENGNSFLCASARATLEVPARELPALGSELLLRGRLEPFDGPRNPGEPDQREIERERGIDGLLLNARVVATLPQSGETARILLARAHAWARRELQRRLPAIDADVVAGELWGERDGMPPELRAEFQETGTVHVLVTAGLHLGVVAALALLVLKVLRVPRVTASAVAVAIIWAYAIFSGLHLPSFRAAAMATAALAARACGAKTLSWNSLAFALLALVALDPLALTGASFALSFSCVGGIFVAAAPIERALDGIAIPDRVREALTLTFATQLTTWPLTASIFLLFSPYAAPANLGVVPVVGITMLLGGAQLLLAPVAPLAQAAANLNAWMLSWIVSFVHVVATLPSAHVAMTPAPVWCIVAYDALVVLACRSWESARTLALAAFVSGVFLIVAPPRPLDETLRITAIDVGQADALVIKTPLGHCILIDAGGMLERGTGSDSTAERVGERTVVPFLLRQGIHDVDAVILSHPHGDHAGGVAPILRALGVTEFADGGQRYGGFAYNDALRTARDEHVPIVYPRAGAVWRTEDGVTLTFIGPSLPFIESNNTINDNSVAFILHYKHFRMLFTGDAGIAAERRFLNEGIDLHADVLKVGHHGSAYSSSPAFIAAVSPKYAVISVGRHNMFGHPAASTVETLQRSGARVYRTDENGAVTLATDGFSEMINVTVPSLLHGSR